MDLFNFEPLVSTTPIRPTRIPRPQSTSSVPGILLHIAAKGHLYRDIGIGMPER